MSFSNDLRYADELAAPPPVQCPAQNSVGRFQYLEDGRSSRHSRTNSWHLERDSALCSNCHASGSPQAPAAEYTMSGALDGGTSRTEKSKSPSSLAFRTLSYLVVFSFFGTISRLVLEALTFYPAAPVTTSVLWANLAGTLVMGFLSEDYALFSSDAGQPIMNCSSHASSAERKADATKHKKTIPLYLGLTTGYCGCLTSFSTFIRDMCLAITNDLPSAYTQSSGWSLYNTPSASNQAPNTGYLVMTVIAIVILEIAISLAALFLGGHMAIALARYTPILPRWITTDFLDPMFMLMAPILWITSIILVVWLPSFPPNNNTWSKEIWRGPALYAILFSPVGCLARFFLALHFNGRIPSFPLGTFLANVVGTTILGLAFSLQHAAISSAGSRLGGGGFLACRVLQGIIDGFCGSMTTVSTWILELSSLKTHHAYWYGFASVTISLIALVVEMGSLKWTQGFTTPACFA